jgi:uncharacterized alpha-E superfamily protein
MLSRTADHLFWMARQVERAESLARMLDAHHRHSLLPHTEDVVARDWRATLSSLGVLDVYRTRHPSFSPATAFHFLAFDRDHAGSIVSCLRQARENARAVRDTITLEMWETLNATWLELRGADASGGDAAVGDFLEWVRYRSHLSRGVMLGTMLRDEAFLFTRIGLLLERADATTRMLLARARPGLALSDDPAGPDAYAWTLLLRSLSAFEIYRRVYRDAVTPWRVTELLMLRPDLPRSLIRCLTEVYSDLRAVANEQSAETERRAGELQSAFRFGRLEQLLAPGLCEYLEHFLQNLHDLGARIAQDFLVPAAPV